MKTVITSTGDSLDADFDLRFGRAGWFCLFDEETGALDFKENEFRDVNGGAGTRAAEKMVEMGVKKWVADVRFIPKFLISAAVFLVAYFFLSFVVPDPLPVIDEIGIGLAAGIVVYILLGRKDIKSDFAGKRRLSLRTAVDRITFLQSDFVKSIEQTLHENESGTIEELTRKILEPAQGGQLSESEREEARHFVKVCESMFHLHSAKKDEKILKKFLDGSQKAVDVQDIKRWVESKKIDVPLYAVYRRCKRTLAASR